MLRIEQSRAPVVAANFILFNLLVFGELKITDALPLNSSSSVHEEELSWDISTDNVAAYSVISMLDLDSLMEGQSETGPSRQKRSSKVKDRVFKPVSSSDIRTLPYYAAVRISDQCSGTLISESHVLTAAHCVHDGRNYRVKPSQLRVGLPRGTDRLIWKKVSSHIHIPRAWKKCKGSKKNKCSLDADYAVLKLKNSHGQKYLKPQASRDRVRSIIRFNGYPGNKRGALWHSSCPVEIVKYHGKLLLSRCTVSKGSSGSGVYKSLGFGEYAVTGVVSAILTVRNGKRTYSSTITNKLTAAKVKKICRWAGRKDC